MAEPTLLGLPAEIRLQIYGHVFKGIGYKASDPGRLAGLTTKTGILGVNRQLRTEARPILDENITIGLDSPRLPQTMLSLVTGARKLDIALREQSIKSLLRVLPRLKFVKCSVSLEGWEYYNTVHHLDTVVEVFRGKNDHAYLAHLRSESHPDVLRFWPIEPYYADMVREVKELASTGKKIRVVAKHCVHIDVTLDAHRQDSAVGQMYSTYRVGCEVTDPKTAIREINVAEYKDHDRYEEWMPAAGVLLLTTGLSLPTFYVPRTGKMTILAANFRTMSGNRDWNRLEEVTAEAFEKMRAETRTRLSNPDIFQKALATATRCG